MLSAIALIIILNYSHSAAFVGVSLASHSTEETKFQLANSTAWMIGGPQILYPQGDSYIRGGSFADSNFGEEGRFTVKKSSPVYTREAFLKFDPSTVTGPIATATLELMPVSVGQASAMTNEVSLVAQNTWSERNVTWNNQPNNQPSSGSVLGSWKPVRRERVVIDVTHSVQTAIREGKEISFKVSSPNEVNANAWVNYGSKEGDVSDSPRLVLNTVTMLYPDAANTESWDSAHWDDGIIREIYRSGDVNDPTGWSRQRGSGQVIVDGRGVATMQGSQPRIYLNGVPDKFWKNVEVTAYYKRVRDDATPWGGMVIGARNGADGHTSYDPCAATTYHGRVRHDGNVDLQKELKHPNSETVARVNVWDGQALPYDQWIGVKFVVYNIENDSKVKLELYRDLTEGLT